MLNGKYRFREGWVILRYQVLLLVRSPLYIFSTLLPVVGVLVFRPYALLRPADADRTVRLCIAYICFFSALEIPSTIRSLVDSGLMRCLDMDSASRLRLVSAVVLARVAVVIACVTLFIIVVGIPFVGYSPLMGLRFVASSVAATVIVALTLLPVVFVHRSAISLRTSVRLFGLFCLVCAVGAYSEGTTSHLYLLEAILNPLVWTHGIISAVTANASLAIWRYVAVWTVGAGFATQLFLTRLQRLVS